MARTFEYLYGAGGLLALVTLALPHGSGRSVIGIAVPALAALSIAVVTAIAGERLPVGFYRALPLAGTVLASCVMVSGDPASTVPYGGFYFWVVLSAFYLFDARWAWLNVAAVGVAFAWVLSESPSTGDHVLAWTMGMGALAVGGGMIGLLRARLEDAVAESQRALASSLESERALAEAQRIAQVGSWEANPDERSFQGSPEFFRILGLDEGTVTTIAEVYAGLGPGGSESIRAAVRESLRGGGLIAVENRVDLPRLGTRVLATRARAKRLPDGSTQIVGTTQDVTERREQEEQLERTLRRLRATIDIGLALGRDLNVDGLLRLISERAQSLLGAEAVFIQLTGDPSVPATAGGPSELRAPLTYRGENHGVLVAIPHADGPGFTRGDEEMLQAFAISAATAVAGVKMVQEDALRRSIDAAERERRRFARELHDQTLQGLASVAMTLESARGSAPEALDSATGPAVEHIRDEIENLRRIIADLRPTYLDELGLAPALEALVERERVEHGLEVAIDVEALPQLGPTAEQTVYRVVQEALTNIRKHAEASSASVVVRPAGNELIVRVEDDGRGFDQARAGGFGLVGMRERLALLGATLEVVTGPNGTAVDARLPLADDAPPAAET